MEEMIAVKHISKRFVSNKKYPGLKGMDSIHLTTSIYFNCNTFLTNDTQLRQVTEANVVLVDDL